MSNKINKYSWIHQLNQAALESKLLSEAKLFEQNQLNEARRGVMGGGYQTNRPLGNPAPEETASHNVLRFLQDIGIPKESLARGVKDIVGIGKQIVHNPQGLATPSAADASSVNMAAYKTARGSRDITPSDVDGNGVVNGKDVEDDVEDNVVGDEDGSAIDSSIMARYPSLQRGMRMGSRHPDAITHDLYSSIDSEIDRRNRSATRYDVADLQRMARLLGNQ